ncbi:lysylphosphatidylglycerol synthase transmembrane domain-containing protein [Methanolacinia paynteri]|uniref:lysylphosphatidylglycerol synthase transmembrane domain-containing protein n=1 Tax=Methanolacinia paynteri TaxID=230356 RepID=UPI00064FD630|nr:lysylphosphatidylglycerol synthase transmembrane domain-containing protein [Methanolacinia paynteri]
MKKAPILGIIISIIFIILAFRNFNSEDFISAISNVNIFFIFLAIGFFLFGYIIRGIRWQIMLRTVKEIPYLTCFEISLIGYMASSLLPMRLGEIIRAYVLGIKENISKLASLSSIILERIFDGMILVLFFGILLIIYPFPEWVNKLGLFIAFLFLSGLIFIFTLTYYRKKSLEILYRFFHLFSDSLYKKIVPYFEKFVLGTGMLKNKTQTSLVLFISILIWINEALVYYILMLAFDITSPLLFLIAIFTMIVINFSIMIPSAPGSIGTYQYFCVLALTLFNINSNTALAYAIVANTMMIVCTVIFGIICMWHMGFSISGLKEETRKF